MSITGKEIMQKHLFHLHVDGGGDFKEIVELPENSTDVEVEEEFKEWVWNWIDAYHVKIG